MSKSEEKRKATSEEAQEVEESSAAKPVRKWSFPKLGRSIEAETYEEACKKLEEETK